MKRDTLFNLLLALVLVLALGALSIGWPPMVDAQGPEPQEALGTAFTYQGRLVDGDNLVNDTCDFQFTLYADSGGSSQVGGPQTVPNVDVDGGLFTAQVDFGASAFNGEARWLKIAVRCPAGSGDYTTLSPLQALKPTPYALFSMDADLLDGQDESAFFRLSQNETVTGRPAFNGGTSGSTSPFTVDSNYRVTNLNADLLDGQDANDFASASHNHWGETWSGSGTGLSLSGGSTGLYGSGSSRGIHGHSWSGVALYARTDSGNGNIIEAWSSGTNRVFYVERSGYVRATETFVDGGADYAELLSGVAGLEPADVLVIGPDGQLTRSTQPYQASVAGVYSTAPGFLAGGGDEDADVTDKVPLAMMGVVPVKASAENGSIQPSDLLTTSSTPGHAMKASPVTVDGVTFYPSGVIVGKALEGLDEGTGVIEMLVVLQ